MGPRRKDNPSTGTDEALLIRARDLGDRVAFVEIYERHRHRVAAFFYRKVFCPETTADLVAETFARAMTSLRRYDEHEGTATAWLFGIANNVAREWVRKGARARRTVEKLGIQTQPLTDDEVGRIEELADVAAMRGVLAASLAELSPAVRDAVLLRVAMDLSYEEVASRLGCSPGAARVRVTRGIAQLAAVLAP